MNVAGFALALHLLAAVIWVGGMFFAYMVLRPSLGALEAPQRLLIWKNVFERFFVWVWAAVIVLLATGYVLVFVIHDGFGSVGAYVHIMHLTGLIMAFLFVFLYFFPYARFRAALAQSDGPRAAQYLNSIRLIVATNLMLGVITVVVAASGRFW